MPASVTFDALPWQADVLLDETSDTIMVAAGLGCGKSRCFAEKAILLTVANYPYTGMVIEPTLPMVRRNLLPAFEEAFNERLIPWRYHKTNHVISFRAGGNWMSVELGSGEHPESLKGPNLAFGIGDEAGLFHDDVWRHFPPRIRHPKARVSQLLMGGTPEGLGAFRLWAEGEWDPNERGIRRLVRASTYDNWHLQPSPEAYVRKRLGHLSAADVERYVKGLFVPLGMRVYPFDAALHNAVTLSTPFDGRIEVGADFNIGKMCWTVGTTRGDHHHVFGEVVRLNTTTWDQVQALVGFVRDALDRWWPGAAPHSREDAASRITMFVDPSAKAHNTRAFDSDVEIIHRAGIREVLHSYAVIPIKDRVASVSWRFNEKRLSIDCAACPELKNALEMQGYGKDGQPEKKRGELDLSGPNDALGYLVWGHPHWRASMPQGNQAPTVDSYAIGAA